MKKRMNLVMALLLAASVAGMTGCGTAKEDNIVQEKQQQDTQTDDQKEPEKVDEKTGVRKVTDLAGREVEIPEKLERVIAVSANDCELVYALGGGDLMVGRGEYCNYPEEAQSVAAVQSGADMNIEQIVALEPQVLIMGKMDQTEEQVKALEDAGITVVMDDATDIEGAYKSIRMVGEVLGKQDRAEEIIGDMQSRFDAVKKRAEGKESASVYFEVSPLQYGLWTSGNNTFMNEIAEMLGLTNIFSDVDGWAEVSEEQVLERNPDYIVTIAMYYGEGQTPVEEILSRPGWENLKAIQNQKLYNANSDEISRPGPRLADAAEMLCDFVYGEE